MGSLPRNTFVVRRQNTTKPTCFTSLNCIANYQSTSRKIICLAFAYRKIEVPGAL
jgi:hypothetical protein